MIKVIEDTEIMLKQTPKVCSCSYSDWPNWYRQYCTLWLSMNWIIFQVLQSLRMTMLGVR